jgi:hypothetical protein
MPEKKKPEILKVEVDCWFGISIQTEDGDWIKPSIRVGAHAGPGLPDPEFMAQTIRYNMSLAYEGLDEQVDLIVSKINQRAAKELGNG